MFDDQLLEEVILCRQGPPSEVPHNDAIGMHVLSPYFLAFGKYISSSYQLADSRLHLNMANNQNSRL